MPAAKPTLEPSDEQPGRLFETWWENYVDPNFEIAALGPLGAKARDAAGDLIDQLLDSGSVASRTRRDVARILTCLIIDAYEADRWEYQES